jgi:hypothetical protein
MAAAGVVAAGPVAADYSWNGIFFELRNGSFK